MSHLPDEARFGDIYQSRFYQFGSEIQLPGDPDNAEDFARAQHYLETITAHLLEFGPVWDKQPQDVVDELQYHNAWQQYEVEQERKAGEKTAEYREIKLQQLQALSKRCVLAFEDTGWEVTQAYRVVCHLDKLIDTAVLEQEQLEELIVISYQEETASCQLASSQSGEIPF